TREGQLIHVFPQGFSKPWEKRDARRRATRAVGKAFMGALRFIVRAWVMIVLVGYAAFFVGLLIALTFARQGGSDSRRDNGLPGGELAYAFLRILGDALFWTFHPWSPFSMYSGYSSGYGGGGLFEGRGAGQWRGSRAPKVPLYERVNRFFFGPAIPPDDPREN
ncbi:MAG: hypothetical protein ACREJ3_08455, partial [Polyangiaceae bacterium]